MSRYNRLKQPRSNQLSVRGLVALFLATMAISLMLLMILFNLVFKNIDLNFNTRVPDMAPMPAGMPEDAIETEAITADDKEAVEPTVPEGGQAAFQRQGIVVATLHIPTRRIAPVTPVETPAEEPSDSVEAIPPLPALVMDTDLLAEDTIEASSGPPTPLTTDE